MQSIWTFLLQKRNKDLIEILKHQSEIIRPTLSKDLSSSLLKHFKKYVSGIFSPVLHPPPFSPRPPQHILSLFLHSWSQKQTEYHSKGKVIILPQTVILHCPHHWAHCFLLCGYDSQLGQQLSAEHQLLFCVARYCLRSLPSLAYGVRGKLHYD